MKRWQLWWWAEWLTDWLGLVVASPAYLFLVFSDPLFALSRWCAHRKWMAKPINKIVDPTFVRSKEVE